MEPVGKLAGKVHLTGPLINDVDEPPVIAVVAVFVTDNKLFVVVDKMPLVNVSIPVTVVTVPPLNVFVPLPETVR